MLCESAIPANHQLPDQRGDQPATEDVKDGPLARLHPPPAAAVSAVAVAVAIAVGSALRGVPPDEAQGGAPQVEVSEEVCVCVCQELRPTVALIMVVVVGGGMRVIWGSGGGVCDEEQGGKRGVEFDKAEEFGGGGWFQKGVHLLNFRWVRLFRVLGI